MSDRYAWRFWAPVSVLPLAFLVWSVFYVPMNMDELNPLHRLGCLYPFSHFHTFRESCSAFALDFGLFSYHRSYMYVGITSSLIYFPLWFIWKSPYSYYLLGLGFLVAFALALTRALGLERRYAVLVLGYFPVAYSMLHDTGPVRLGLLSFPVLVLLATALIEDPRLPRKCLYGFLAALLMVFCVEDKPFYLYLLPVLLLFIAACRAYRRSLRETCQELKGNWLPLTFAAVVFAAGVLVLLFVGKTEGQSYFSYLTNAAKIDATVLDQVENLFFYTFSFPIFGHQVFYISIVWAALFAAAVLIFSVCFARLTRRAPPCGKAVLILLAASYLSGFVVFSYVGHTWAGHHFVYLHVPLLASLLIAARSDRKMFRYALGFVLISNLLSMGVLSASQIPVHSAREREALFEYLGKPDVARENVINFSSFGGYFIQSLYGDDDQLVTYIEPLNAKDADELSQIARKTSRDIINVCADCDAKALGDIFGTPKVTEIECGLERWKMFRIDPR